MIKAATVYTITGESINDLSNIDAEAHAIVDPALSQWGQVGFSPVIDDRLGHETQGGFLLNVQFRDRVLPGSVIKTHLDARIAEAEARTGEPVTRAERMTLKDGVVAALLPTAFIKPADVPVVVIGTPATGGYLVIGSISATRVDSVLTLLRAATIDTPLEIRPFARQLDVPVFLSSVLHGRHVVDDLQFECATSVVMQDGRKATVRFRDVELSDNNEIAGVIADGFRPTELHIYYGDTDSDTYRIAFTLNDKGVMKRIRFADVLLRDVEEESDKDNEAAYFDGTAVLVIGEMKAMLNALSAAAESEL